MSSGCSRGFAGADSSAHRGVAARTARDSAVASAYGSTRYCAPMATAMSLAAGRGCGEVSISSTSIAAPRSSRAASNASSRARSRPGKPSRAMFGRPSVIRMIAGVCPFLRIAMAKVSDASIAAASGVPPPPGSPARLRLARANERVGGNKSSAAFPRNAFSANLVTPHVTFGQQKFDRAFRLGASMQRGGSRSMDDKDRRAAGSLLEARDAEILAPNFDAWGI